MRPCRLLAAALLLLASRIVAAQDLNTKAIGQIQNKPGKLPFTFVLIGDPQGEYQTFRKVLMQSAEAQPIFILVLGDLTASGGEEDYRTYVETIRSAPAPVLSLIGNHDLPDDGRSRYEAIFGKPDRFFDYAGCRFILLDNAELKLMPSQTEWLDEALTTENRKFIFMHCPPFLGNWWSQAFTKGSRRFLELARAHQVKRVFMGHLHIVDSLHYEGVDYVICGSGGIRPALLPIGQAQIGFVSVKVAEGGEEVAVHPLR